MSDERLVEIESRLAHQDQLLLDLNDVVTRQQATIMQLQQLCQSLVARVRSIAETLPDPGQDDAPPPHY